MAFTEHTDMEHSNYYIKVREIIDQRVDELASVDIAGGIPRSEARLYAYARMTGYLQSTLASLLYRNSPEEAQKELDKLKKV